MSSFSKWLQVPKWRSEKSRCLGALGRMEWNLQGAIWESGTQYDCLLIRLSSEKATGFFTAFVGRCPQGPLVSNADFKRFCWRKGRGTECTTRWIFQTRLQKWLSDKHVLGGRDKRKRKKSERHLKEKEPSLKEQQNVVLTSVVTMFSSTCFFVSLVSFSSLPFSHYDYYFLLVILLSYFWCSY